MNKMIVLLIVLIGFFNSCNFTEYEAKRISHLIVVNPERITDISSEIQISDLLKNSINNFGHIYIKHFYRYKKNYLIQEIWKGVREDGNNSISIIIIDEGEKIKTEFEFIEQKSGLILHNILLTDHDVRQYFFKKKLSNNDKKSSNTSNTSNTKKSP